MRKIGQIRGRGGSQGDRQVKPCYDMKLHDVVQYDMMGRDVMRQYATCHVRGVRNHSHNITRMGWNTKREKILKQCSDCIFMKN